MHTVCCVREPACCPALQAGVFQLQPQHWRLADASWWLVTLLQMAAATLTSVQPQPQGPNPVRRSNPSSDGSTRPRAAAPSVGDAGEPCGHDASSECLGSLVEYQVSR